MALPLLTFTPSHSLFFSHTQHHIVSLSSALLLSVTACSASFEPANGPVRLLVLSLVPQCPVLAIAPWLEQLLHGTGMLLIDRQPSYVI